MSVPSCSARRLLLRPPLLFSPWHHRLDVPAPPSLAAISSSSMLACRTSAMDMRTSWLIGSASDDEGPHSFIGGGGGRSSLISSALLSASSGPSVLESNQSDMEACHTWLPSWLYVNAVIHLFNTSSSIPKSLSFMVSEGITIP